MKLLQVLRPFTQSGILKADDARKMVEEYAKGNLEELKAFVTSVIPMKYLPAMEEVKKFVQ